MQVSKFEREYFISSYECDSKGELRIVTLMNIFQDVADSHAENLGVGIEYCLKNGLAWFGSNYYINIARMPKWHEKIKIVTWPSQEKKIGAVRDFKVLDGNGETIIVASSQWVLINFEKKRPVALRENLPMYTVVEERAVETDFPKIELPQRADYKTNFAVRYDDIDVNGHVNNAVYPLWATEAVDKDFRKKHKPAEIEIAFKKECLYGETVEVTTQLDGAATLHEISDSEDKHEIARIRILWR
jgi:medium-chain acyl-[acyl-carrier-protein] hydrolase